MRHITRTIQQALDDGVTSRTFLNLIEDWGRWARCSLIQGYRSGHTAETVMMDDDTGLAIDEAMGELRRTLPNRYRLVFDHFVRGKSFDELSRPFVHVHARRFNGISHLRNSYSVDIVQYKARSRANAADVKQMIFSALEVVFEILRRKSANEEA